MTIHCDISIVIRTLKGPTALFDNGVECIQDAIVVDVHYPNSVGVQWFTIINSTRVPLSNAYVSKVRIHAT